MPDTDDIEREIPATTEHPEDLLHLVPKIMDGAVDVALQDKLTMFDETADRESGQDDDEED